LKIVNPTNDFLFTNELLKNRKYINSVYERIFVEITKFIEAIKDLTVQGCQIKKKNNSLDYIGKIHCGTKKYQYIIEIIFHKELVEILVNGKSLGESVIFGAHINKETLSLSKIKIDIMSFKKELSKTIF